MIFIVLLWEVRLVNTDPDTSIHFPSASLWMSVGYADKFTVIPTDRKPEGQYVWLLMEGWTMASVEVFSFGTESKYPAEK